MSGFDPRLYMTKLSRRAKTAEGGWKTIEQDYLEVKWRLLWFRTDHPDGHIAVEVVKLTDDTAVVRATASWPDGGSSSDIGTETMIDWKDFAEKAATKAIGRALASLGYGVQFCGDHEFDDGSGERVVDAPVARPKRKQASVAATAPPAEAPIDSIEADYKRLSALARRIGFTSAGPICAAFGVAPGDKTALVQALPSMPDEDGTIVTDWGATEDALRFAYEEAATPPDAMGAEQPEMIPAGRAYHP